jgi:hypothetical protein
MAIEDIKTTKAPADWQPSADQRQQIANDRRLQNMSRDDLYAFFHHPAAPSSFSGAFHERAQQQQQASGGLLGGVLNKVTNAMRRK